MRFSIKAKRKKGACKEAPFLIQFDKFIASQREHSMAALGGYSGDA